MFEAVLWSYIGLLLVGGTIGYVKAGSAISLVSSVVSAVLLALCAMGVLQPPLIAQVLVGVLLVLFVVRYAKGKKLVPSGVMAIASFAALVMLVVASPN